MTRARILGVAGLLAVAVAAGAADQEKKAEKPVISCDQIVETYKSNHSVDETATTLLIDQSRVAECLKAKGIKAPAENDR